MGVATRVAPPPTLTGVTETPDQAAPAPGSLAAQLLDAQVAHHLDRLRGDRLAATARGLAEDLLTAASPHQVADLVDREAVKTMLTRALTTLPGSAAAAGLVELVADVLHDGPPEPYPIGDLVDRDQVETLLDALLAQSPLVERALDRLAESPLVGTVASRFMGRIVGEVLQANKAVADKVPGLGTLMSFGTSAASMVVGAADRQFEGLLGDTVGKSSTFAVRRLTRIVVETMNDPTTRDAVLQVWDLVAAEKVSGLSRHASREEIGEVIATVHDVVVTTARSEHLADLVGLLVDEFFERFGGYTTAELLEQADVDPAHVVEDVVALAPGIVELLDTSGELERLVRAQLAPFYASPEVSALLG